MFNTHHDNSRGVIHINRSLDDEEADCVSDFLTDEEDEFVTEDEAEGDNDEWTEPDEFSYSTRHMEQCGGCDDVQPTWNSKNSSACQMIPNGACYDRGGKLQAAMDNMKAVRKGLNEAIQEIENGVVFNAEGCNYHGEALPAAVENMKPVREGLHRAIRAIDHSLDAFVDFFLPLQHQDDCSIIAEPGERHPKRRHLPTIEVEDDGENSLVYSSTEQVNVPENVFVVKKGPRGNSKISDLKGRWLNRLRNKTNRHIWPFFTFRRGQGRRDKEGTKQPKNASDESVISSLRHTSAWTQGDGSTCSLETESFTTNRSWFLSSPSYDWPAATPPLKTNNNTAVDGSPSLPPTKTASSLQIFEPVHMAKTMASFFDEFPPPFTVPRRSYNKSISSQPSLFGDDQSCHYGGATAAGNHEPLGRGKSYYVTEEEGTVTTGESSVHLIRIQRITIPPEEVSLPNGVRVLLNDGVGEI